MSLANPDSESTSFEQLQETYEDFFVPQFSVTVGGTMFEEADGVISDVSVDLALDKATAFSFTLNYPYSHERGEFEGLDWDLFAPDQTVAISMGYGSTEKPLLHRGHITSVKPSFPSGSSPTVSVEGYGLLHKLTEPPEPPAGAASWTHTWENTPPHEVVKKVVNERGYPFDDIKTVKASVTPTQIKQDESDHDLAFLLQLGEDYAYELRAWEGVLHFEPPRYDGPADLTLAYGSSLDSFSPEINETDQVDKVEVRNWSAERGEEIIGTATRQEVTGETGGETAGGEPTTETLRLPVRDTEEANARAAAVIKNRLDGSVSGKGKCIGLPEIRPGSRINIEGLTDRFTNVYYVDSATHRFGGSGYQTSFSVKRREL